MSRILALSLLVFPFLSLVLPAQEGAAPAKPGAEIAQKMGDLRMQIRKAEMTALQNNADLQAEVDKLEKQRRDLFVKANPDLEALYTQMDAVQEEGKAAVRRNQAHQKPEGEKARGPGKQGEGKPRKGPKAE